MSTHQGEAAHVFALRQAYWRNGYRPVPVYSRQKRPRGDGWRVDALQNPPVWAERWPEDEALSTGLLTGQLAAIDVDILIQAVADHVTCEIDNLLGATPLARIGLAPKILLAYRCEGNPFGKLMTGLYIMPDGSEAKVEVLADGQQFVADGIHPDTGQPYEWLDSTPEAVPLGTVPSITVAQARNIVAKAREIILAAGGVKKAPERQRKASGRDGFFAAINAAALGNLAAWVKHLFPTAAYQPGTASWRVPSKDRGRPDLQEDISFNPNGIRDFGVEQGLSPIDAVMEFGGATDAVAAAHWLCGRLSIAPATLGYRRQAEPHGRSPVPYPPGPGNNDYDGDDGPPPDLDPDDSPSRILTGDAFISTFEPPDWLIEGIVQSGRLYSCTSLTGHGKTAVWLYLAMMIHAHRMVGSLEVTGGNVVYIAGENPDDLKARMHGMAGAYKLKPAQLPYVLPATFPMTDGQVDTLIKDIAKLDCPLALIVADTASSFFPSDDENDNVQAGAYARTLRRLTLEVPGNPAVVALCHPTKNAARGAMLPRGGGAFVNELDANLTLWSESQGEVTELHWHGKIRGPDFAPLAFRLRLVPTGFDDRKERPVMTIVAEPMSEEAAAEHAKQTLSNQDVVLMALRDDPEQSLADIAEGAGWMDAGGNPMRSRVQRAITSLSGDKLIERERRGAPWNLTEKGEKALKDSNHR